MFTGVPNFPRLAHVGTRVCGGRRSIAGPSRSWHSGTSQNPICNNDRSVSCLRPPAKAIDPELKSALDALRAGIAAAAPASKLIALQTQVDAIDVKVASRQYGDYRSEPLTLLKNITENEGIARMLKDGRGTAVLHLKGSEVTELMDRKSIISCNRSWHL